MNDRRTAAFVTADRENRGSMYRAAYVLRRRGADAEDAVSSAVEAAWRRLGHIRDADALRAYLMRCCINAAKKELRRRKRYASADALDDIPAASGGGAKMSDILSSLEEKYRIPLLLKFSEGYHENEIAAILRLPRGTVSSRISRALCKLREEFNEEA